MPAFSAINLDPEENVEEEIDTSKEIQVEEALKLFQNALKLHAQGPRFLNEASEAYDNLFRSDIFKFPESATDYERTERQQNPFISVEPAFASLDATGTYADGTSLPQTLFLSYKNHGQLILDRIKHKARGGGFSAQCLLDDSEVIDDARKAIDNFKAALDQDPSDAELWRRTARTAAFLNSARTSRYCLEAAIELDDDPVLTDGGPPSLVEGLAGAELKGQLHVLQDDIALTHPAMKPYVEKKLPSILKRHVDPLPFLPNPTTELGSRKPLAKDFKVPRHVIKLSSFSWTLLGVCLADYVEEGGSPGQGIFIELPQGIEEDNFDTARLELDEKLDVAWEPLNLPKMKSISATSPNVSKRSTSTDAVNDNNEATDNRPQIVSLPSRKRSVSAAGLPEAGEEENCDTKRPKRVRRRDTLAEEAVDETTLRAAQLQPYQGADQNLFQMTRNILENLGVTDQTTVGRIGEILDSCALEERTSKIFHTASTDLRDILVSCDDDMACIFLDEAEITVLGLNTFLEHTKAGSQRPCEIQGFQDATGIRAFVVTVNGSWMHVQDVALHWLVHVSRTYKSEKWSDLLKTALAQVMSRYDAIIYARLSVAVSKAHGQSDLSSEDLDSLIQMIFELHLDVYERITNPNSRVEPNIRVKTKTSLYRWLDLAAERNRSRPVDTRVELSLRFLWACVLSATLANSVARDHVLACWHSLRDYLAACGHDRIELPNNAVMPEVSTGEADREISKITTMEFFLGLFQEGMSEPVAVIDTLEPVLNPDAVFVSAENNAVTTGHVEKSSKMSIKECASQGLKDLWKFLFSSSTDLRLLLWSRLSDAYGSIKYTTKQFSCLLKSIEMVINDLDSPIFLNTPTESRKGLLLKLIRSVYDMMVSALSLALNDNTAFDIIDEDHLRSTSSALARLSCLMHVAAMQEDEFTLGITPTPSKSSKFNELLDRFRQLQVRTWTLQYCLIKVGIHQNVSIFKSPDNDLADYLSAVHQVLGVRKACSSSNKVFLKLMRIELLKQKNIENWEDYLGQVLYDLNGLKLGVGVWEIQDHGCVPEKLERRQAMQLVDKIMILANRMSMKDLLKSDLKNTIEHMQGAIGQAKSTMPMIHNLRNFQEYIKRPIHPLRLYQALNGTVPLDAMTVNTPEATLAKHRWFFLLGMIALTKFKGVDLNRRQTPGATDDLRIGATFLRLQLQFTPDMWEAWFRLAECFDYELDEAVLWSADKMNKERCELLKFQRQAIHCYTLALSHSYFFHPETREDEEKLCSLYYNFAMRMYASSREPFAMEPFQHGDYARFYPEANCSGTFKRLLHKEMTDFEVWKYAAALFRRAMKGKPKDWRNPYMLAKCLWKMFQKPVETLRPKDLKARPSVQSVVDALAKTIEVVSFLPKPRHGQEPILEPHYKIVSVLHKLVNRDAMAVQEATDILQRQPYAIHRGEHIERESIDEWESYVIEYLRHLRDKDKSHWQHRIIMRHARVVLDPEKAEESSSNRYFEAQAAFAILREHMVTKTMAINVWKCDAERPGRHHVFTEQYVRYVVRLLIMTNDRVNTEALLRKIRKKGADFYHFNHLWATCVQAYTRLLRHTFKIPSMDEDVFKNMSPEGLDILAERVSDWAGKDNRNHHALNAMKEAIELKKLNGGLTKAGMIDDLINDCYSVLYVDLCDELAGCGPLKVIEERQRAAQPSCQPTDKEPSHTLLRPNGADWKEKADARAPSEAPSNGAASGEKMESSTSNTGEAGGAVRRRVLGVRRADILRKAEQAVLRATEAPAPKSAVGERSNGRKSRRGSTVSGKHGGSEEGSEDAQMKDDDADEEDKGGEDDDDEPRAEEEEEEEEEEDEEGEEEDAESEAASPRPEHDDADDESDLSDVPDDYDADIPPTLMFPNLRRSVDNSVAGESSAEESGDEEGIGDDGQEGGDGMDVDVDELGQEEEMAGQQTGGEGEEAQDDGAETG